MQKMTTSDVNVNALNFYRRNLLQRAKALIVHDMWADVKPLPKGSGTYQTFMRVGNLANAPQLAEGVPPSGKKASVNEFRCSLVQFGDFLTFTDKLKMTAPDARLVEFTDLLGDQAGETLDIFHRDQMQAGTQVRYAGDVADRSSVTTAPSKEDCQAISRILDGNKTKLIKRQMNAGTGIGTEPVAAAYIGLTHTDCRQDWEDLAGFVPVHKYSTSKGVLEGEIGFYPPMRARIIATTQAKVVRGVGAALGVTGLVSEGAANIDVYCTIFFGAHFYGSMPLQKGGVDNIVKQLGNAGFDPLNQFGTSGWKAFTGGTILNDNFGVRYEHGATDL